MNGTALPAGDESVWRRIFSVKMLICTGLGFSSGLPLYLLLNLVSAWLRDSGADLRTIGLFSVCSFPYVWKFLWSPLLDRYSPLGLGRRRGWMILTQLALFLTMGSMGFFSPGDEEPILSLGGGPALRQIHAVMALCFLVSLFSATQDIALDAYRREILDDAELGLGNSIFINAYRLAGLVPGALSLYLSDILPWSLVFVITAAFMSAGVVTSFLVSEPERGTPPRTLRESVVEPFADFVRRRGIPGFAGMIVFIFLYKFGDSMATALSTPFYMDMGYTRTQIGLVNKMVGLWAMVAGSIAGGIIMLRIGINRALWLFGVGQIVTILGFVAIAHVWKNQAEFAGLLLAADSLVAGITGFNPGAAAAFSFPSVTLLSLVVGGECLGAGLGTACFVAYMCRETGGKHVATQLALLTALAAVPRTVCNATTGYIIEAAGYENFFVICYALAIPGMLMLLYVAPYGGVGAGEREPAGG